MEWRPIDTAPKDGSEFLAWAESGEDYWVARWDHDQADWVERGEGMTLHWRLSHWQPLPAPPPTEEPAMSDAPPKSWNDPNAAPAPSVAEPVQTRDAQPVEARSRGPLVVVNNNYADGGDRAVLAAVAELGEAVRFIRQHIERTGAEAMVAFSDLMSAVERNNTVIGSVVTYIDAQKAMTAELQAALDAVKDRLDNGSDAELQGVIDQMNAATDRAAAAITANTPEPTPEPQPEPEQPAPEQPAEPAPAEPVAEQPAPEQPAEPAPSEPVPAEPAPDAPAPDGTGTVTG